MSLFKHVGASQTNSLIEIQLIELKINISAESCEVVVVFQRGDRKTQTLNPAKLQDKVALFNKETLRLPATLYYDEKKKLFQSKIGSLIILIKYQKGLKKAGEVPIDFSTYLNAQLFSKNEIMNIQNCPDKYATLNFMIKFLSADEKQRSRTPNASDISSTIQSDKLQEENYQLKRKIKQIEEELVQSQQQSQSSKCTKCAKFEKQLEKLKQENQDLEVENQQLTSDILSLKQEKKTTKPKKVAMNFSEEMIDIEKANKYINLEQTIVDLNTKLNQVQIQNTELKEELSRKPKSKDNDDVNRLSLENGQLKKQLKEWEYKFDQLKSEMQEMHFDERDTLKSKILQQQKQIDDLEMKQNKAKISQSMQESELKIMRAQKDEYEHSLDELSHKYDKIGNFFCKFLLTSQESELIKVKENFAMVMHECLAYGDPKVIEIVEYYSQ